MVGKTCCVGSCKSSFRRTLYSFRELPWREERRRAWLEIIRRTRAGNWIPPKYTYVCGDHFVDGRPTSSNPDPVLHMEEGRGDTAISSREIRLSPVVDAVVDQLDVTEHRSRSETDWYAAYALLDLAAPSQSTDHEEEKASTEDEYLLVLIRIRLNVDNRLLAHLFSLTEPYVSELIGVWIPFLAKKLRHWVSWIERYRQRPPPRCFRLFPRCVAVLDCFELKVEKVSNAMVAQHYWSQYKHSYTVEFLICSSPHGCIMYISEAWGGRTTDNHIVQASKLFLDKLLPKDVLLADRGFDLKSFFLLNQRVELIIPKFLTGTVLSREDCERGRKLSEARIHVERVIGLLRNFRVLNDVCPVHLLHLLDDIVVICSAIVNMCPPIVR